MQPPALIICGPTASGKSALALEFARALGGTVINADAMQVYAGMAVITAQPSLAEHAAAPHRLYGIRSPAEAANLAWWREEALAAMAQARLPILCGGTGMYLRALTQGLSALPAVPPEARAEARRALVNAPKRRNRGDFRTPNEQAGLRPQAASRRQVPPACCLGT
jgi:tRNA dimethylallyltransferase